MSQRWVYRDAGNALVLWDGGNGLVEIFFKLVIMYKLAGCFCEPRSALGQYNAPKIYHTISEYLKKVSAGLSVCVIVSSSNSVRCH